MSEVLWVCEDDDTGFYNTQEEALSSFVEFLQMVGVDELPEGEVTLRRYRRVYVRIPAGSVLRGVLEDLDEDWGDPDGDYTKPTTAMQAAEAVFLKVVEEEYVPWACVPIEGKTETVNLREWAKVNMPEVEQ